MKGNKVMKDNKALLEILSVMKDPSKQAPVEHHDLYTEEDPVIILDDGSFLRSEKIRDDNWQGPGILEVYAPWCPYCQAKVEPIKKLAKKQTIYVLDGTVNPMFRFSHGVSAYPTFYKVLADGTVGEEVESP
jgi:thiol-disulfide isomerase/thioredoxin